MIVESPKKTNSPAETLATKNIYDLDVISLTELDKSRTIDLESITEEFTDKIAQIHVLMREELRKGPRNSY